MPPPSSTSQQFLGAELRRIRRARPLRSTARRTASRSTPRPSSRQTNTDLVTAPPHLHRYAALRRLAGSLPFRGRLDAVGDRVAHRLHQRALHRAEDLGIEPNIAAARHERDAFAEALARIARGALQRHEHEACGQQTQTLRRLARLGELAIQLLDAVAEIAVRRSR